MGRALDKAASTLKKKVFNSLVLQGQQGVRSLSFLRKRVTSSWYVTNVLVVFGVSLQGDCCITPGAELPADFVIHSNSPRFDEDDEVCSRVSSPLPMRSLERERQDPQQVHSQHPGSPFRFVGCVQPLSD